MTTLAEEWAADPEKRKAYHRAWRAANPDKVKAARRKYVAAHPEKEKARHRKRHEAHREERNAQSREWYAKNREARRRYEAARKDQQREYRAAWTQANPAQQKARVNAYRARRLGAPGEMTPADIRALRATGDGICSYCFKRASRLEIEHCTPLSRGGWHSIDNCVMVCKSCNSSKAAKTVLEFLCPFGK